MTLIDCKRTRGGEKLITSGLSIVVVFTVSSFSNRTDDNKTHVTCQMMGHQMAMEKKKINIKLLNGIADSGFGSENLAV